MPHDHRHDPPPPKLPPDEFTADLEHDSAGRQSSSMEGLVQEDAVAPPGPDEEQFVADPEAHHQHSRKGQAESPREVTLNQPERKQHTKYQPHD
jgi:hypothetical protein